MKVSVETNDQGEWKIFVNGQLRGHYSSAKTLAEHFGWLVSESDALRRVNWALRRSLRLCNPCNKEEQR